MLCRKSILGYFTVALLVAAFLGGTSRLQAIDFVRGDANADAAVSAADALFISSYLFRGVPLELPCHGAADANGDQEVDLADGVWLLQFIARDGPPPPAPFPDPGSPVNENLGCDGGVTEAPVDPSATIEILDATAVGGDDNTLQLTVVVTSARGLVGYSGSATVGGLEFDTTSLYPRDLTGTADSRAHFLGVPFGGGVLSFAFLNSLTASGDTVSAQAGVAVLEITGFLQVGTPAGSYTVSLQAGELFDAETALPIAPLLGSATVTVLADVTGSVPEEDRPSRRPPVDPGPPTGCDDGEDPVEPRVPPAELDVTFRLADADVARGDSVIVPFFVASNGDVNGYTVSVDFDEEVFEVLSIEKVWAKPDGSDFAFAVFEFDNTNAVVGNDGVSEGWILGATVFDFCAPIGLPADVENEVLRLHLLARPDAPLIGSELRFEDGAEGSGEAVRNGAVVFGENIPPELANSFVFVHSRVNVLPEITLFRRGETNNDGLVDISDGMTVINHLFLGTATLVCRDAADANDDGRLDGSDPVRIFDHLFVSGASLPPPFVEKGDDPTEDALGCAVGQ